MPPFLRPWNLFASGFGIISTRSTFSPLFYRLRRPLIIGIGVLFIFVFGFGVDGLGQATRTWLPTTGGLWTTNANWSGGTAPVAGDNVIINTNQSAAITAVPIVSLGDLTISGTCIFQGSASGNTVTVAGIFTIASGKTFTIGNTG